MQIPNGINEIPFSTFLNLGAIVCKDTPRPMALDHVTTSLNGLRTPTVMTHYDVYDVTTSFFSP